jgi:GT2 family glycosyltransferase
MEKTYILILNYNNWADTIECLESVLRNNYPLYQVIVIDNNSPDNSIGHLKAWAEGRLSRWTPPGNPLRHLSHPPVMKPIPYIYYTREEAERGGNPSSDGTFSGPSCQEPLIFIQTGENLGFARGNNVGIRHALANGDAKYIWLLNNDTIIEGDSLTSLVREAQDMDRFGAAGSVLLNYAMPDIIQTVGGNRYFKYFGFTRSIHKNEKFDTDFISGASGDMEVDYISGCSFLLTRGVIEKVGLLDERYFMYWEDADWCERIKQEGLSLVCSLHSKVYHKKGKGSSSLLSSYFSTSSCLEFYGKFHSGLLRLIVPMRLAVVLLIGLKNRDLSFIHGALKAYRGYFSSKQLTSFL